MNFKEFEGANHKVLINLDLVSYIERDHGNSFLRFNNSQYIIIHESFEDVKKKIFSRPDNFGPR